MATSTLDIYLPIKKTDTVFTKILDKLYCDNEFTKNINRLESGNEKDIKKAFIIKKTLNKIRVYGSIEQPLLLARDVGILMGISNIRLQLKYYNTSEKVIGLYQMNNGKVSPVEYLTWKGFIRAASNSRSTLSDLFREFIYELVAEAVGDAALLDKITKRVIENNPELVDNALTDLDRNLEYYKLMYEREAIQRELLQENLDKEIQLRLTAEHDKATAELDAITRTYEIKKITEYAQRCEHALLSWHEFPISSELELSILRKRYMRALYIYIPTATIYKEWTNKKDATEFVQYIPDYVERIQYIQQRVIELSATEQDMQVIMNILVPHSEYFYIYLTTTKLSNGADDFIFVHTEYYTDKQHLDVINEEINSSFEKLSYKKKIIYHMSIDELHMIVSQKLKQDKSP